MTIRPQVERTLDRTDARCPRFRSSMARRSSIVGMCVTVVAFACVGGCEPGSRVMDGAEYPTKMPQARSVDVQVIRDGTTISMVNTTAKALPKGRLWINAWFSHEFDGLGVGESLTIGLGRFQDRYGKPFNEGGFFGTTRPDKVVLVQVATDSEVVGLVVVGNPAE